jgi:hypothetical protein
MGLKRALLWSCLLGTIGLAAQGVAYEDPEAIIEEKCANDWPDNTRMRLACIEQQQNVLKKSLESGMDTRVPLEDHTFLREKCAKDWPDDFRSRAKCEENQIEGYLKWQAPPPQGVTLRDYSVAVHECAQEWPDDFRQRARCLERRLAAVRLHPELDNGFKPLK